MEFAGLELLVRHMPQYKLIESIATELRLVLFGDAQVRARGTCLL